MPDRRDNRDGASEERVGDGSVIERGEIVRRPSAARQDDGVNAQPLVILADMLECADDGRNGPGPLHQHVDDHDLHRRAPLLHRGQHVLQRRAGARRDHGHAFGEPRQRLLALGVEITPFLQFLQERLKLQVHRARAHGLQLRDIKLRAPLRRVVLDRARRDDLRAVRQVEPDLPSRGREHHARDARLAVGEGEPPVRAIAESDDLAHDAHRRRHAAPQRAVDALGQLGDPQRSIVGGLRRGRLLRRRRRHAGGIEQRSSVAVGLARLLHG